METAHRVLRNHSQRQERPPPREAPQPRAEPALAPAPGGDLRLVKSVSESHTPCPAGGTGPRGDVLFCGREGPESLAVGGGPSRWRREPRLGKMVAARAPSALLSSVLRAKRPVVRGRSEHTFSGTLPPRSTPWLSGGDVCRWGHLLGHFPWLLQGRAHGSGRMGGVRRRSGAVRSHTPPPAASCCPVGGEAGARGAGAGAGQGALWGFGPHPRDRSETAAVLRRCCGGGPGSPRDAQMSRAPMTGARSGPGCPTGRARRQSLPCGAARPAGAPPHAVLWGCRGDGCQSCISPRTATSRPGGGGPRAGWARGAPGRTCLPRQRAEQGSELSVLTRALSPYGDCTS